MEIEITKEAEHDLLYHKKTGDKATLKKITRIFEELEKDPYKGVGKPEPLKYGWAGYWSRNVDKKNRIVYFVDELKKTVTVISAKGHYGDK